MESIWYLFWKVFNHVPFSFQHPAPVPKPHPLPVTSATSHPSTPTATSAITSSSSQEGSLSVDPLPPSSIGPLQLARINQLYNMILPHQGGGGALGGRGTVDLEGHAPTADLNLFKEARRVTQEMLVCYSSVCHVTLCVDYIILGHERQNVPTCTSHFALCMNVRICWNAVG